MITLVKMARPRCKDATLEFRHRYIEVRTTSLFEEVGVTDLVLHMNIPSDLVDISAILNLTGLPRRHISIPRNISTDIG